MRKTGNIINNILIKTNKSRNLKSEITIYFGTDRNKNATNQNVWGLTKQSIRNRVDAHPLLP